MPLRDWLNKRYRSAPVEHLQTQGMDGFADDILLELKGITSAAIAKALEERESRYMRSILKESYFSLDALVIKALDAQTAKEMESFLINHEAIHPDFRRKFFSQTLQREYRSSRGATVRVQPDFLPVIELDPKALERPTQDEEFIVSLKGRKVRFEAEAQLAGPLSQAAGTVMQMGDAPCAGHLAGGVLPAGGLRIHVSVHDRLGFHEQLVSLPLLLGREGQQSAQQAGHGAHGIDVDVTYVSRRQLIVFELLGQVYCMVPGEASLTCAQAAQVMKPMSLLPLHPGQPLEFMTGFPVDAPNLEIDRSRVKDYAVIVLELMGSQVRAGSATPRPRAIV